MHFYLFAGVMRIITMDDHDGDNLDGKYHDYHMMYDQNVGDQRFWMVKDLDENMSLSR